MKEKEIFTIKNILWGIKDCLKGKYSKKNALLLFRHKEDFAFNLHDEFKNKKYNHSGYNFFVNYDSKKRVIASACLKDKIVHRVLYNNLNGFIDKGFIFDSYACRISKGSFRAIKRCQKFLKNKKLKYFLKMDVKKYFDSVNHKKLKEILKRMGYNFDVFEKIINSYSTGKNIGMPIGNLTSQMFANIYLHELDMFVKHQLKIKYYIRYMDDFVILHYSKEDLKIWMFEIENFLKNTLYLLISNGNTVLSKIKNGVIFLGKRIFWNKIYILRKAKNRLRGRMFDLGNKNVDRSSSLWSYFGYISCYNYWKFNIFIRFKISKNINQR